MEYKMKYNILDKEEQARLKEARSWFSEPLTLINVEYNCLTNRVEYVHLRKSFYDVRKLSEEQKVELNKAINLLNKKIAKCFHNSYDSHGCRKLFCSIKHDYELSKHEKVFKKFVKSLNIEAVSKDQYDKTIKEYVDKEKDLLIN